MNAFLVFSLSSDFLSRRICRGRWYPRRHHGPSNVDTIFLSNKSCSQPGPFTFYPSYSLFDRKSCSWSVRVICYCLKSHHFDAAAHATRLISAPSPEREERDEKEEHWEQLVYLLLNSYAKSHSRCIFAPIIWRNLSRARKRNAGR